MSASLSHSSDMAVAAASLMTMTRSNPNASAISALENDQPVWVMVNRSPLTGAKIASPATLGSGRWPRPLQ